MGDRGKLSSRILLVGDLHLHSKNYGSHRDYPKESLWVLKEVTRVAKENGVTHIVGLGDFTFGRFHNLEYRKAVEDELREQNNITHGNRYELKGNHDSSTSGMTEFEFYQEKGLLKSSTNLRLDTINLSMVDFGGIKTHKIIEPEKDKINIVLAHDFIKFHDTPMPNWGKPIELDNLTEWFGVDYIFCGHIHSHHIFSGVIQKDGLGHKAGVVYPGCMTRPAYDKNLETTGYMYILKEIEGGVDVEEIDIKLWDIDKSFCIEELNERYENLEDKKRRVDLSDIVKQLDNYDRTIGSPEVIIQNLKEVDSKYKEKALALLKAGMES